MLLCLPLLVSLRTVCKAQGYGGAKDCAPKLSGVQLHAAEMMAVVQFDCATVYAPAPCDSWCGNACPDFMAAQTSHQFDLLPMQLELALLAILGLGLAAWPLLGRRTRIIVDRQTRTLRVVVRGAESTFAFSDRPGVVSRGNTLVLLSRVGQPLLLATRPRPGDVDRLRDVLAAL